MSSDYSDLLRLLFQHHVRFLVVGGHAVTYYAEPRYTKDLDLLIAVDDENAQNIFSALRAFGAPLLGVTPATFMNTELCYQMGAPPVRIDILMSIPHVAFEEAWENRVEVSLFGIRVPMISKADLLRSKQGSSRYADLMDVENLSNDSGV